MIASKIMTEIFDGLSVVGDPVTEEDSVVYLLSRMFVVRALRIQTAPPPEYFPLSG